MTTLVLLMKRGDTAPEFRAQCLGRDGITPVNLSTATAVKLLMRTPGGPLIPSPAMVVEDQTTSAGWVHRNWQTNDLNTAATYHAEVEVTWSDSTVQTFPADGHVTVYVTNDLG